MTDAEWMAGYARLQVAYTGADRTPEVAAARGRVYREILDDLTAAAWHHAVRLALQRERYFPTIAALHDYADEYRSSSARELPEPPRTPEERERGRQFAREGLKLIREALANPSPLRSWPATPAPTEAAPQVARVVDLEAHAQRVEELRRQAELITAGD